MSGRKHNSPSSFELASSPIENPLYSCEMTTAAMIVGEKGDGAH
jgi:hypothetical protein